MNIKTAYLKDNKRRFTFKQKEKNLNTLKWALYSLNYRVDNNLINLDRTSLLNFNKSIYKQITYSKANSSITRIQNRCYISGNSSSTSRFFRLSRMSLLEQLKITQRFVGVTRASLSNPKVYKTKFKYNATS